MRQHLAWDDLHLVLAVGRAGSLSGAARALHLDHSTLHRRIGKIEGRLGVRLFARSRTGYTPTPAGEIALEAAESMDGRVLNLETRIAGQDLRPSGHVRITTSDTVACTVLTPILRDFRGTYPEITLEVEDDARVSEPHTPGSRRRCACHGKPPRTSRRSARRPGDG